MTIVLIAILYRCLGDIASRPAQISRVAKVASHNYTMHQVGFSVEKLSGVVYNSSWHLLYIGTSMFAIPKVINSARWLGFPLRMARLCGESPVGDIFGQPLENHTQQFSIYKCTGS